MLKLITARANNILSIDEAQNHLHVDSDTDISYIEGLIYAAQNYLDDICNRSYVQETYDYYLNSFPASIDWIIFPVAPISEITSVKYYDADNVEQTLVEDTDYYVNIISEPGYIRNVESWPMNYDKPTSVIIRLVTGVTSPEIIPIEYKQAALLLIGDMYKNREDTVRRYPTAVDRLVSQLRLF